jgi:hypothetical protein
MENKELLESAMFYGFFLGLFWAVKYVFFIWGCTIYPFMGTVYVILSSLTIVFAYLLTKVYKIRSGRRISFFHAWKFGVLLYFFAALIVSLEHYFFYRYIAPPDFLANATKQTVIFLVDNLNLDPEMGAANQIPKLTPIKMTIQGIFNNVFYGVMFSVPVAAIVSTRKIKDSSNQAENQ